MFFISVGIYFTLAPMIIGAFYTLADTMIANGSMNAEWIAAYEETESTTRWLVPLIPTILIFVAVIKILMVASVRGRD